MHKKNIIYFFITLISLISLGFYFYFKNANSYNYQYQTDKTSTSNNELNQNENNLNSNNNIISNNNSSNTSSNDVSNNLPKNAESKETEISTFSTTLYSKDIQRQNNIQITCSALSGTVVKSGEIFSFCSTVGPATSDKGYQKADIFDNKGNKKKGYGGGNCQISSTLYNAVMTVPNLEIIERHPHSNKVPYVKKDKDAAVAYGSYDFKFKNNTGNDIRILASVDSSCVTTSLWTIPK